MISSIRIMWNFEISLSQNASSASKTRTSDLPGFANNSSFPSYLLPKFQRPRQSKETRQTVTKATVLFGMDLPGICAHFLPEFESTDECQKDNTSSLRSAEGLREEKRERRPHKAADEVSTANGCSHTMRPDKACFPRHRHMYRVHQEGPLLSPKPN